MENNVATVVACLVVLIIMIAVIQWCAGAPKGCQDGFFTEHGQEEPTRAYTPYVGTLPHGYWGVTPWADVAPPARRRGRRC